jgi:hypothetical protein
VKVRRMNYPEGGGGIIILQASGGGAEQVFIIKFNFNTRNVGRGRPRAKTWCTGDGC